MENNLIIRPMTKNDIDGVYEVEENCFVDTWSKDAFNKELKNDLARYLVAEIDNKIVGYVGIWFVVDEGHITNVAVHSDYRGRKIGDRLVSELVELCKKANWDYETLCCLSENEPEQWLDGKLMKSPFQKRIRNDYFLAKNGGIL